MSWVLFSAPHGGLPSVSELADFLGVWGRYLAGRSPDDD
jgi:hypothetical protein